MILALLFRIFFSLNYLRDNLINKEFLLINLKARHNSFYYIFIKYTISLEIISFLIHYLATSTTHDIFLC